ncbi:LuxR C-terminal-related transcriptional regulator [Ktedonobacter sp. SOSP1-85]|uniref:LuxR C-terminal-related transcriptional regulator n=1 Tax=Ktedonobacter sp. SOSP1-85 TaxID=2778367 RepID=UPI001915EF58|nr:LuxR C-terminal-related transcriptional regulator [Ktedonobacter sp. SOSP1-85]
MPKTPAATLTWSPESNAYNLHISDQRPMWIELGTEGPWFAWLTTHTSFSFQGQHGHLNVYKEQRARGAGYWYAYHTAAGQTHKRYLGRSATVTLTRLEEVARVFRESPPGELQTAHIGREATSTTTQQGSEPGELRTTIVMTRLSPPHLPATLVVRERLLAALDTALTRPLTLLSASAGWGKTTLLASWAHRHPQSVAWFPLEEMDNDPTRFWTLLIEALRRCWPGVGERALTLLQASAPLATSLAALLNELAGQHAETSPILLILDDYHVINESTIHSSLTFWLEHLPPHVHLLLASRTDPELPLARLRVRGHLGEVRNSELRFTQEETQDFLTQRMGLALSETDVALLQARTEGWIASLQLAALVLQKHADPSAYVQILRGNQRFLLDYLREEVLASLPEALQDFLLQTSGLDRLSALLCDALTGREDSDHLLEQVERANLFLQPLDESRQWYRYHALWAQAMQHEARLRLGAAAVRELHRKASQWYEQQRLLPEAIEAALRGEHFSRATALIGRFVAPNSFRNEYHLVCSWLRRIPDEVLQAQPELCFQAADALMITTDRRSSDTWTRSEQLLQWAEQGFEAREQWERRGDALQLHAVLAFFQEDLMHLFALTHQAQPLLTERSLMYSNNLLTRGYEALLAGEVQVAWQYLLKGYEQIKNLGDYAGAFGAALFLGEVCLEKGELRRASHYFHQALGHIDEDQSLGQQQFLLETGGTEPFFVSWAYHCLARLAYEHNEVADAQRYLLQALALRAKPEDEIHVHASGGLIQARLLHACGKTSQAQELLLKWERHARFPWSLCSIRVLLARLRLAQGDLHTVEQWAQAKEHVWSSQTPEQGLSHLKKQEEALLLARLHIAQQRGETALKELAPWKEKAQAQGRKRSVLEVQILEALAHATCQEHSQARSSLLQALRLAHPENYQRVFLDEGSAMEALLKTLLPELRETALISYTRILLRAFAQESGAQPTREAQPRGENSLLLDPLSEQEQRVLRLLAAGRSNPEIANTLVLSLNTVKTHVQSLYRKLDVHSRVEASEAARRFSLL